MLTVALLTNISLTCVYAQIPVPRRYHRALFGEKAIFLRDIESKTNCKITFPGDGLGELVYSEKSTYVSNLLDDQLDVVSIFGPESQVHQAGAMLLVSYDP